MKKMALLSLIITALFVLAGCGGHGGGISSPRGSATVDGTVVNATNNQPLAGARACFVYQGHLSNICDISNQQGRFTLSQLPAGTAAVEISKSGFISVTENVSLSDGATVSPHISLSPSLTQGEIRIVLTWQQNPRDIDSHLWAPSGGSYYEVYYRNQGSCSAAPWSCLDVDETDSYGPETITIKQIQRGTYKYALHWYAGSGDWAHSGAKVRVYDAHGLVKEYHAPADTSHGVKSWWYVFDLNGAHISDRNTTITDAPPEASGSSLRQSIK